MPATSVATIQAFDFRRGFDFDMTFLCVSWHGRPRGARDWPRIGGPARARDEVARTIVSVDVAFGSYRPASPSAIAETAETIRTNRADNFARPQTESGR